MMNTVKINVLFMGTPDIAEYCLDSLMKNENVSVKAVVTQADKPRGRGHKLMPPPVKEYALNNGIDVYQPETLKDGAFLDTLNKINPDLIVVVAYGKILPQYILSYPKYGCVNVHASLLPKYRGAAPIQWAVLNGERETGVTTMMMDEGLDTGDMLDVVKIALDSDETSGTLFEKMKVTGAEALNITVNKIASGTLERTPQDHSNMTYAPMITNEFCYIDFSIGSDESSRLIKGLNPHPGAKTTLEGKILKLYMAKPLSETSDKKPGTVIADKKTIKVVCGDSHLIDVTLLQPEGKKKMDAVSFLLGYNINNFVLGE